MENIENKTEIRRLSPKEQLIGYIELLEEVIACYQSELDKAQRSLKELDSSDNNKVYHKSSLDYYNEQ